ncbi:hypothetical protein [Nostoc sp.]
MADQLIDLVFEHIAESWDEWCEGLSDRTLRKSPRTAGKGSQ